MQKVEQALCEDRPEDLQIPQMGLAKLHTEILDCHTKDALSLTFSLFSFLAFFSFLTFFGFSSSSLSAEALFRFLASGWSATGSPREDMSMMGPFSACKHFQTTWRQSILYELVNLKGSWQPTSSITGSSKNSFHKYPWSLARMTFVWGWSINIKAENKDDPWFVDRGGGRLAI